MRVICTPDPHSSCVIVCFKFSLTQELWWFHYSVDVCTSLTFQFCYTINVFTFELCFYPFVLSFQYTYPDPLLFLSLLVNNVKILESQFCSCKTTALTAQRVKLYSLCIQRGLVRHLILIHWCVSSILFFFYGWSRWRRGANFNCFLDYTVRYCGSQCGRCAPPLGH